MAKGGFPRGAAGMNTGGMMRQQAQMQHPVCNKKRARVLSRKRSSTI